jgi:hypothetical protein
MAKKGLLKKQRRKPVEPALPQDGAAAVTLIEAQLDVAGAAALHQDLLDAMSRGAVRIELSDGQATQPALQLLVAARNSARAGQGVSFGDRATAVLQNVIEECV